MPKKAFMYGLPYEDYEKYAVRKYGFHGTSHRFVTAKYAKETGKSLEGLNIVTCHLETVLQLLPLRTERA